MPCTFDSLSYEVVTLILSYVPVLDQYIIKQAGCYHLTNIIRELSCRRSRAKYLEAMQADDLERRQKSQSGKVWIRPAMEIMIQRGQPALVLHFLKKYSNAADLHKVPSYDIERSQRVVRRERKSFALALHWAAWHGQIEIVRLLIDRIHIRVGRYGLTALHAAAGNNRVEVVQLLLENGAYINALDDLGRTPLGLAERSYCNDAVDLLTSRGAQSNAIQVIDSGEDGWETVFREAQPDLNELDEAIRRYLPKKVINGSNVLKQFINYVKLPHTYPKTPDNPKLKALLRAAVGEGSITMASFCLDAGCDIDARDFRRPHQSALSLAVRNPKMTGFLLNRGANPLLAPERRREELQVCPLHEAFLRNQQATIKVYREHGFTANSPDHEGRRALHLAIAEGLPQMAQVLINEGADCNSRDDNGTLPLNVITTRQTELESQIIWRLIKAGADLEARNEAGETPLALAIRTGGYDGPYRNRIPLLMNCDTDLDTQDNQGNTLIHKAACLRDFQPTSTLLTDGVNPNIRNHQYQMPIHVAFASDKILHDYLVLLLNYDADVNAQDSQGNTALHLAVAWDVAEGREYIGGPVTAKGNAYPLLLEHDADTNVRNNRGRTPLHILCSQEFPSPDICRDLICHGANVNEVDDEGHTALHLLLSANSEREPGQRVGTYRVLREHGADR